MRYLCLDVGDERIGVAISDELGALARPLEVLRRASGPGSFQRLAELVHEYEVGMLVVGLPLLEDGTEGEQVRSTRAYVRGLRGHVDSPIVFWDERDSTKRAEEIMSINRRSRRRRQGGLDAVAAAVILQSYLDAQTGEGGA
ncbi:MAG: Holliday junction resolvase RuvX [Anaerolineae bacterium]|nr:Holliday junction resolvase RuvX [Anaerolineae bacterium]